MNKSIVKTFFGKHVDMSKIVSIGDAYFIDHMGSGGWYVGFDIEVQLRDEPIKYVREVVVDEEMYWGARDQHGEKLNNLPQLIMFDGTLERIPSKIKDHSKILAVRKLQWQIDDLIQTWKEVT